MESGREPAAEFHPAVDAWFRGRFPGPTEPQRRAWPAIAAGRNALIAAPTGSGKTLAAFLAALDALVREGLAGPLPDLTRVIYVSPLKALSNDIHANLEAPLAGIRGELARQGLADVEIRTLVRTGDTPQSERQAMRRRPPHVLVTTPESLYILLTSESGARLAGTARTVIVDEIHAVVGNKRGCHLALTLERLAALVREGGGRLQRVGLSATQRPIEEVARFLVGADAVDAAGRANCEIFDSGHRRRVELKVELPRSPLAAVLSNEAWAEVHDRIAELARERRTTVVFVNTRRLAERMARDLGERLGSDQVAAHHGSLARDRRLDVEARLASGRLKVAVATASLELGIDIGEIDLVCVIGSVRSIATLLQRVGRSGHRLDAVPEGRLFPTTRDELVECAALLDAVRRGELESLTLPARPCDVLAQQIVAAVAGREWDADELFALVRRAWPYRDLPRAEFDQVVGMLAAGFSTRRGRRGAWLHHDAIHGRLRARRGARLVAITSGGAIPDRADYQVVLQPGGIAVGTVDEDFAVESMAGDIFQLGNASWRIERVEQGRVLVEDARGQPPTIPFWFGESPGRSRELSAAVARLRSEFSMAHRRSAAQAEEWLAETVGVGGSAARAIVAYLSTAEAALGALPDAHRVVLERFFDEAGNQHVVIHAPLGVRVLRAWGLALRKRFCRKFNFELQAAANDDAIVLSLGPTHSFPLEEIAGYLRSASVRELLVQAVLDAPMFTVRWRWAAALALAVPRFRGGRRVPPRFQRMQAEDLISLVFPDQLACAENLQGDREVPDHPLVRQALDDCLCEAMDVLGLERLLAAAEAGEIEWWSRDLREPSPLAAGILNARPWAFLDDAPLEERRTQAVAARRWLDAETAADLGRLDAAAIERVRSEVWPEPVTADELHDALMVGGFLTDAELDRWRSLCDSLVDQGRVVQVRASGAASSIWVAAERREEVAAACPAATFEPDARLPAGSLPFEIERAAAGWLASRLEIRGPVTTAALAFEAGLSRDSVASALGTLEAEGFVLRGRFTPEVTEDEWCERRLLARIHRATLDRLRREIAPVSRTEFLRFAIGWQRAEPGERAEGPDGLLAVLQTLEGFEAPAAAWEEEILPARVERYDPAWLDTLCLAGRVTWGRLSVPRAVSGPRRAPVRTTPIAIVSRDGLPAWSAIETPVTAELEMSTVGAAVAGYLASRGASFFDEIVAGTGLIRTEVECALAELVALGRAASDAFAGLRALIAPSARRPPLDGRPRRGTAVRGMAAAGRWALLRPASGRAQPAAEDAIEIAARAFLRRWGIVCRGMLERESLAPPWRELLGYYRRAEARGELRGGRFVDGFSGEQFALPEALARLRATRRSGASTSELSLSAVDPLHLPSLIGADRRIPVVSGNRILLRNGVLAAALEAGEVRCAESLAEGERWTAANAVRRRIVPPALRAWTGRAG